MKRILAVFLLSTLCATTALASTAKIGFVNTERIFRESQLSVKAQKKLEKEFSTREQEIQKLIRQARDLQAFVEKEGVTLSEAERGKRERELAALNRDIQRSQREFREDLNQRKNEEFASIHERARKTIIELAEKEKYDFILENAVYANPRLDITDRVIKTLDR